MSRITKIGLGLTVLLALAFASYALAMNVRAAESQPQASAPANCALLDDPTARGLMSAMYERKLLLACGRSDELGGGVPAEPIYPNFPPFTDVIVNNPAGDTGTTHTQSETSIAINLNTGTICSGYNDSFHGVTQGMGYAGFSRSTDGGATFEDRGPLDSNSYGDPSIVWRRADGYFYFASIHATYGIGMYRSTDDCLSFQFMSGVPVGDDKELMAIDNNLTSLHYGRIYVAATNFGAGGQIYSVYSDNGTTWSSAVAISASGASVQGAWPTVAPNGDVYVSWVRWNPYPTGPIDIEVTRSTNGGVSYNQVTNAVTGKVNPRDASATNNCGRPALNGDIRYLPSPQIAVGPDGVLHIVYAYDPDGYNTGDVINVYYSRSTDNGATWGPEVQLNDDGTLRDQFFPSLSVGQQGVATAWYDRRLDSGNYYFTYFSRVSSDGGITWEPNAQISDVQSPVYIDPQLATCYHGDYDQQIQDDQAIYFQWSDDRNVQSSHNDPDIWFEKQFFAPDFTLQASPEAVSVCALSPAQYDVTVGSLVNFTQPVTLTLQGAPLGSAIAFSPNPVSPPGASLLSVTSPISAAWGTYNLDILGASIPPTYTVHTATVGLALFTNLPGLPELLFPAPEASSVSRLPTFLWAAEQGASFDLEVATDPGFSNLVIAASALTQTTFTPATPLAYNTVYFWRIKAHNTCGDSPYSPVSRFLTEAALGSCTQGRIPVSVLSEDFESGAPDWSPGGAASTWAANSVRKHGGAFSFKANDVSAVSDQWLTSPLIALPAAQSPLTLQYWNYQQLQSNPGGGCFDGGLVEISTDGGLSWSQLTSELQTDPYDGLIASGTGNPLAGRNAWCGHPQPWTETIITLDAFAGQQVLFRYRLGTNNAIASDGWYLDDLSVQACAPSSTLGPDSTLTGAPATVVTHTFTLQNLGETDSYLLSLSGSTWDAHIVGANPVTVTQDGSVQIAVAVQLPPQMSVLSDTFTLSAASVNIPGIVLETTGASALSLPVGLAWSASQSAFGAPGETVLYTFTLTNTGSLTDTFTLATGGAWLAALPGGLSTGPLAAGESATIVLAVTIPADALAGELDTTLLTAASTRDLAISASTSATTTAAVMRKVYLPLVMK